MGDTNEQNVQNAQTQASAVPAATAADKEKSKLPVALIGLGAAAAALVLFAIILIAVLVNSGKTINLNKYASITVSGYDTVATARLEFDKEQFKKDYGNKIKYKGKEGDAAIMALFYDSAADCLANEYLKGSFDKSTQISNGDVIVYSWDCDEAEIKKVFGYKVKCKDIKMTVKDLEQIATFDPFEGVEVIYTGLAPNGSAEVKSNSTSAYASQLRFQVEPGSGLSNGDVVTVKVYDGGSQNPTQYFINVFNAIPTATEKQFTVDGLGSYATSASQIPDDTMEKMKSQGEDTIRANVANNWSEESNLDSCNYIGNYFLTTKNSENYGSKSMVILVYELQATIDSESRGILDTFTYYACVTFTDPILLPDGTCSVDLSRGSLTGDTMTKSYPGGWFGYNYYIKGYESLDTLMNKNVTTLIDRYSYENNVSQ